MQSSGAVKGDAGRGAELFGEAPRRRSALRALRSPAALPPRGRARILFFWEGTGAAARSIQAGGRPLRIVGARSLLMESTAGRHGEHPLSPGPGRCWLLVPRKLGPLRQGARKSIRPRRMEAEGASPFRPCSSQASTKGEARRFPF
jgi:hypothetical protein